MAVEKYSGYAYTCDRCRQVHDQRTVDKGQYTDLTPPGWATIGFVSRTEAPNSTAAKRGSRLLCETCRIPVMAALLDEAADTVSLGESTALPIAMPLGPQGLTHRALDDAHELARRTKTGPKWPAYVIFIRDTGFWFVGPFTSRNDAGNWAIKHNPHDDPRWQVVELAARPTAAPVFAP